MRDLCFFFLCNSCWKFIGTWHSFLLVSYLTYFLSLFLSSILSDFLRSTFQFTDCLQVFYLFQICMLLHQPCSSLIFILFLKFINFQCSFCVIIGTSWGTTTFLLILKVVFSKIYNEFCIFVLKARVCLSFIHENFAAASIEGIHILRGFLFAFAHNQGCRRPETVFLCLLLCLGHLCTSL